MRHSSLRRAVAASAVLAAAALTLSSGVVRTTFALFNGETTNANSAFAGGWVGAPSGASATPSGYDIGLSWTAGTHGPVTGQQVLGVDNLTNSNCTGAAYSSIATLGAAAGSYTDANRANGTNNGDWYCYELVSTSATVWTSSLALSALQIGLVANALSTANGGTANAVSKTDTIKITFNQQTTLANQTGVNVCVYTSGAILIGDSTPCAGATDTYSLGKLTVTGATLGSNVRFNSSTTAVSTSAPWTLTVTLAGTNSTSAITGTPTWKFTPSSSILSHATTHQATICTAATTNCQPTATTTF